MLLEKYLNEDLQFTIKDNVLVGSRLQNEHCRENENNAARVIWDSLSAHPKFVAQIDAVTGRESTFSEIKSRAIRCALWLRKRGVVEGDVIAIITPQQEDDFIPFLATLFVNAVYTPWNHGLSVEYTRRFLVTCRPKITFASTQTVDRLAEIAKANGIVCEFVVYGEHPGFPSLNDLMSEQTDEDVKSFEYVAAPRETTTRLGMIFFSLGSTGTPKATKLSYDCLVQDVVPFDSSNNDADRWLWYSPLGWISGTICIACMMQWRYTRILHAAAFDPDETSRVIEKYKVKAVLQSPTMLTSSYKAGVFARYNYESVRMIIVSSSIVAKTVLDDCKKLLKHTFIANFYGMTEAGQCLTRQTKSCRISDSIGFVYENVMLKVTDEDTGKALGPNEQGEICFKISTAMLGYMNADETSRKDVVDDEGWIHTGDLGYYSNSGEVVLFDRINNVINNGKFKVSLTEIQNILLGHHEVAKCAVVAVRYPTNYDRPFAFVVRVPNAEVTADKLIELAIGCNKNYKLKGSLIFVDDLLYTPTGKLNLKVLRENADILARSYRGDMPDYIRINAIQFIA